jgi:hypothetical protein
MATFFESPTLLFQTGNALCAAGLLATLAVSWHFAAKLPNPIPDFWARTGGQGQSVPRFVGLAALPVLAALVMAGAAFLTHPDVTTLVKAQTGFWLRLVMAITAPALHGLILSGHAKNVALAKSS